MTDRRERFLRAASDWQVRNADVPCVVAADRSVADAVDASSVVLVEGLSDRAAIERLAGRVGIDLPGARAHVVSMGGATNVARFVEWFGPGGLDVPIAGLVDRAEARHVERALGPTGRGTVGCGSIIEDLARAGWFVCDVDLEDELIRALGPDVVESVIDDLGELRSFRALQRQPAQHDRTRGQQLHRFMSSKGGRKIRYAAALVDQLTPATVPSPLRGLLEHVRRGSC